MSKKSKPYDKYEYYLKAVQSPDVDCEFLAKTYRTLRGKPARVMREDFCGTHAISCEWVKMNKEHIGYGVDLDPVPIRYGQKNYASKLNGGQRERLHIIEGNVLTTSLPKADIINALNFSYYFFKTRLLLKRYFMACHKNLNRDGLLIADCFGGSDAFFANEEKTRVNGEFYYYWDQVKFDPISNEALFYIHFKRDGERKREKQFKYDWRMWTIPEIREIMMEAGFKRTHVYWEGTTRRGFGDGIFRRREHGEDCAAWVAYVVGEP